MKGGIVQSATMQYNALLSTAACKTTLNRSDENVVTTVD